MGRLRVNLELLRLMEQVQLGSTSIVLRSEFKVQRKMEPLILIIGQFRL